MLVKGLHTGVVFHDADELDKVSFFDGVAHNGNATNEDFVARDAASANALEQALADHEL